MLVIANGTYKSGSSWLFWLLVGMTGYPFPPEQFARKGWNGTGVEPKKLRQFLDEIDRTNANHVFKAHIFLKHDLIAQRPNVRVMHITRDIRDALVSAFYYEKMKGQCRSDNFESYYWRHGRRRARYIICYNRLWETIPNKFVTTYEALHASFEAEVHRMADHLGISLKNGDMDRLRQTTNVESLREKYAETDHEQKFFRRGVIGDWQSHFTPDMLKDLENIEHSQRNFPNALQRLRLKLLSTIRPGMD
jgi:hypothetical protein